METQNPKLVLWFGLRLHAMLILARFPLIRNWTTCLFTQIVVLFVRWFYYFAVPSSFIRFHTSLLRISLTFLLVVRRGATRLVKVSESSINFAHSFLIMSLFYCYPKFPMNPSIWIVMWVRGFVFAGMIDMCSSDPHFGSLTLLFKTLPISLCIDLASCRNQTRGMFLHWWKVQ